MLRSVVRTIQSSSKLFIPADKSTNLYKMQVQDYKKLLHENITAKYQKTDRKNINIVNHEAKELAEDLQLDDRIERFSEKQAFITLKDHKESFKNKPTCCNGYILGFLNNFQTHFV